MRYFLRFSVKNEQNLGAFVSWPVSSNFSISTGANSFVKLSGTLKMSIYVCTKFQIMHVVNLQFPKAESLRGDFCFARGITKVSAVLQRFLEICSFEKTIQQSLTSMVKNEAVIFSGAKRCTTLLAPIQSSGLLAVRALHLALIGL
jgi:hypothetical protein